MSSSHDTHFALPSYDDSETAAFIRNDIDRNFQIRSPDTILTQTGLFSHLVDNQFYLTHDSKNSMKNIANSSVTSSSSHKPSAPSTIYTAILKQIKDKKIGFDFLTDIELMSFLTSVISNIDTFYRITDLSESLTLFFRLVIA